MVPKAGDPADAGADARHPVVSLHRSVGELMAGFMDPRLERAQRPMFRKATAFFPGGSGMWGTFGTRPLPAWGSRQGGVMVLGNDFGHWFKDESKGELAGPTWRGIRGVPKSARGRPGVMRAAGVDPSTCFFTNAYMGIRAHDKVGERGEQNKAAPPLLDPTRARPFMALCQQAFQAQMALQAPRVIVTLGAFAPAFLQMAFGIDDASWCGPAEKGVGEIPKTVLSVPATARGRATTIQIVALVHPSFRHTLTDARHEAEVERLEEAVRLAGLRRISPTSTAWDLEERQEPGRQRLGN